MNPVPELAPQLKQLRLSGILDSLDARNRQALDGKLAYTEFLAMLIEDEVARREHEKFQMRLRRATFRATKTLEQFDFERLPKLNRTLVHELATGRYLAERAPVLIVGPCATGSYERKLATLARVPLLIIDDFGLKPLRPPADADLHDLIAERYEQAATVVTSNLDRLRHNAYCLVLDGESFRAPRLAPGASRTRVANGTKNPQA